MNAIRQVAIVSLLNFRNLRQRHGAADRMP